MLNRWPDRLFKIISTWNLLILADNHDSKFSEILLKFCDLLQFSKFSVISFCTVAQKFSVLCFIQCMVRLSQEKLVSLVKVYGTIICKKRKCQRCKYPLHSFLSISENNFRLRLTEKNAIIMIIWENGR